MTASKSYLFALSMGVLVVILTHFEAKHQDRVVKRSTYIKHFTVATSISLATVYFVCSTELGGPGKNVGSSRSNKSFQPEIMTGNPNF